MRPAHALTLSRTGRTRSSATPTKSQVPSGGAVIRSAHEAAYWRSDRGLGAAPPYARHFLLISFVIYVITAVLVALLSLAGTFGALLGLIISFAATYVVQASLIKAVQDVRDGRVDLDLSQTVQAALPYLLPVIGASILAGIGIAIGFVLIIVPGLILLTFWCLIVPFIVIGGSGVFEAFGNSMRTVRGYAWRVFGTYVLVFLILIAFTIVIGLILIFLPLYVRSFVNNVVAGT